MERDLAKLAIAITLQQRNGGKVEVDFDDLEEREDVSTFDVPKETVGFLLGAKGAQLRPRARERVRRSRPACRSWCRSLFCPPGSTLRAMETKHRVFMFFNNDRMRQGKHVRIAISNGLSGRFRGHRRVASLPRCLAHGDDSPLAALAVFVGCVGRDNASGCTSSGATGLARTHSTRLKMVRALTAATVRALRGCFVALRRCAVALRAFASALCMCERATARFGCSMLRVSPLLPPAQSSVSSSQVCQTAAGRSAVIAAVIAVIAVVIAGAARHPVTATTTEALHSATTTGTRIVGREGGGRSASPVPQPHAPSVPLRSTCALGTLLPSQVRSWSAARVRRPPPRRWAWSASPVR